MTNTPTDIQQKQLEIWLSKTLMERLRQTPEDNDALFALWANLKKNNSKGSKKSNGENLVHTCLRLSLQGTFGAFIQ